MFNDSNVSCTDGEVVYIGSDVHEKDNFDVAVGLALHEASHIVYSDMELYKNINVNVPRSIYNLTEPLNISKQEVAEFCKMIFNYIEDRYIIVFTSLLLVIVDIMNLYTISTSIVKLLMMD
jgi:predicted metal-dependent peptidase